MDPLPGARFIVCIEAGEPSAEGFNVVDLNIVAPAEHLDGIALRSSAGSPKPISHRAVVCAGKPDIVAGSQGSFRLG
jgi:hypothetical protein